MGKRYGSTSMPPNPRLNNPRPDSCGRDDTAGTADTGNARDANPTEVILSVLPWVLSGTHLTVYLAEDSAADDVDVIAPYTKSISSRGARRVSSFLHFVSCSSQPSSGKRGATMLRCR
jgi:hypothetical protein